MAEKSKTSAGPVRAVNARDLDVLRALTAKPLTRHMLQLALNLPRTAVNESLAQLSAAGLVSERRWHWPRYFSLTPAGQEPSRRVPADAKDGLR